MSAYQVGLQALIEGLKDAPISDLNAIDWEPIPNSPQEKAYHCQADVIGYGGAAGGGKSHLLLGKAFTQHQRSRILRAKYTDLQRLIDDGDSILDGLARYVYAPKRRWDLPDGRSIMLRAADRMSDTKKHKGDRVDFLAFDEADEFTENMVRFMMGWAGTTDTNQRVQTMLCFNPPDGAEGEWLINYFGAWIEDAHSSPAQDGEIRYYIYANEHDIEVPDKTPVELDGQTYYPESRTFFRALVQDNPYALATGYDKTLSNMAEPYRSLYYLGLFNAVRQDDAFQVIPTAWILLAEKRWLDMERPDLSMRSMGVDVARGGDDRTVIAPLYGTYFDELEVYSGKDTPDGYAVENYVVKAIGDQSPDVGVDVIGIGASAYDLLKVYPNFETTPINNSRSSSLKDKSGKYGFTNTRSASWWMLREALDPVNGDDVALPPSRTLRNDLRAPRYKIRSGKYAIESKDDIKKRIGRSPDEGDAVVMSWFITVMPKPRSEIINVPNIFGRFT